ncbi:heme oxygenase [Paenibacillus sp. MMO-177]|uniref:heme oxygenase n=1 Tax=Paenibacillus sp. MMO-177 TaxID=3081289 RepID=UPI00301A8C28
MIVVTNRIKVVKGMGAAMATSFTASEALDLTKGLVKVEVLLTQNLSDYDELSVNMYWESMEYFTAWKASDSFKAAHKRPEPGTEASSKQSPILGSELITYEVASLKEIL